MIQLVNAIAINKFLLYILLTLFISTTSYSCALCHMAIPKVRVDTKVYALPNKTRFEVTWEFEEKFVFKITRHDLDKNGKFAQDQQDIVTKSLENYLYKSNFLTHISYSKTGFNSDKTINIRPFSKKMVFKNGTMYYHFNFDANFILQKSHTLTIKYQDKQKNFNLLARDVILKKYPGKYFIKPMEHYAKIILNDPSAISTQTVTQEKKLKTTPVKLNVFLQKLSVELKIYKDKIKTLLNDIKQNNSVISYLWLLFFSFVYGALHSLGPGHGKSLVASYFLSGNRSLLKAFNISLLIGIVHAFSAFLLTVVIYLVLTLFFASFVTNVEYIATKLSAIVIISIASYLIYKKYKASKKITFSMHKPHSHSYSCSACNTRSTDLGVILAAGIIPCPSTVTIFIFTFGLGIYYVGFLSAIFMGLGMSLVIFITAYLSINVRKKSSSNATLRKALEYGSLIFILCLGLFLLFM